MLPPADVPAVAVAGDIPGQGDGPPSDLPAIGEESAAIGEESAAIGEERAAIGGGRDRLRRRWAVAAAVALVAAVGAGVVTGVSRSKPQSRPTPARLAGVGALSGDVVAVDAHGQILLSNPADGAVRSRPRVGASPHRPVAVALDGRDLIGDGGRVVRLGPRGVTASDVTLPIPRGGAVALPDPFADQDRAVVVLRRADDRGDATVTLAPLGGGRAIRLGQADGTSVAGDPRALGVFAAVPAPLQPSARPAGGTITLADSAVELRDAGEAPLTLATAAALNRAVRQRPDTPVHLGVYPSPTGDRVAVVVETPGGQGAAGGLVVLDRRGGVVAAVPAADGGPVEYVAPTWSPDGRLLAYPSFIRYGPEIGLLAYPSFSEFGPAIAVWDLRHPVNFRGTPDPGVKVGSCVWSPGGSTIVCPAARTDGAEWVVGRRTGSLVAFPDRAIPVAWLASG